MMGFSLLTIALLAVVGKTPQGEMPRVALFIHGAGGGGWEWRAWVPVFERAGWICVAEDLVPATEGIAATRLGDYVNQVEQWGNSHRPCKLALVGASMGGILALKASEKLKPDAIVLVNSVGPAGIGPKRNKTYPKVIEWSKGTLQETRDSMPDSNEETIQFAFHHWRDESGAVLAEISKGVSVRNPSCRVLIVLGDQDTDVPNQVGREMAKRFHEGTKTFKGMSHVGPLLGTRAKDVAEFALRWLDEDGK